MRTPPSAWQRKLKGKWCPILFWIQVTALADTGEVQLTAEAPGYASASARVRAGRAAFTLGDREIRARAFGELVRLGIQTAVLDPANGNAVLIQSLRQGVNPPSIA